MIGRALCALMLAMAPALAAASPPPMPAAPAVVEGAVHWDQPSAATGRTYRIKLYVPALPPPPEGYPVFYVLDSDLFFAAAADSMRLRGFADIRPAIIVGIGYTTASVMDVMRLRTWDLTPVRPDAQSFAPFLSQGLTLDDTGGAETFHRFITAELRPHIAARWKIDARDQTLFGHSFGGLFVLHALFNHPESFRTFVAASPSIWWADKAILRDARRWEDRSQNGVAPRVLILVGGDESDPAAAPDSPLPRAEQERAMRESAMVENARALGERLAARIPGSAFMVLPEENHFSVQLPSLSRALSFALAKPTPRNPKGTAP